MRTILTIILAVGSILTAGAFKYSYTFNDTPLSEAIVRICKEDPNVNISFIYKDLENYSTTTVIDTDDPYEALRHTVGFNPVTITVNNGSYFVEALQHGKFRFTGTLTGSDHEPVAGATIMLLNPADSAVITFGVSEDTGRFSIPCDSRKVLAKLSSVGYATIYRQFDNFNVGNIMMPENAIKLKTVNVEARSATALSDRTVYLPSQRQKSAAQDATDLLRFMAIPQLKLNPQSNSVTDNFGKAVAVFINGMEATDEELQGLRTADVRKIEYLEFPSDPRFKGAEKAINFVVQEYAYGGYTKATVIENTLIGLASRVNLFSRFSYGRMNYDVYIGSVNRDNSHTGSTLSSSYLITGNDGKQNRVEREEVMGASKQKEDQLPVTLQATYSNKNVQIRNTVGYVHNNIPEAFCEGKVTFDDGVTRTTEFNRCNPIKKNTGRYAGSFFVMLPKEFSINVTPTFNYTHTDDRFKYEVAGETPLVRNAEEDAYNFRIDGYVRKNIGKKHSLTLGPSEGLFHNTLQYTGTNPYHDKFRLNFFAGVAGYNYHTKKFSLSTDAGLCWESSDINGRKMDDVYPFVHLFLQYAPSVQHSFSSYFQWATNSPGISEKASDILKDNEYLYITGNPYLKDSRHVTLNLGYTWLPANSFSMSAYGRYFTDFERMLAVYSPFEDGRAVIRNYQNQGNFTRTHIGVSATLKLLGGALQLSVNPEQYFYRSSGAEGTSYSPFELTTRGNLYLGQFYISVSYFSPERQLWSETNTKTRTRSFQSIEGGWSDNNWNIRLTAANFFNKGWETGNQSIQSTYYSEERVNFGTMYHPRLNLSVTYTINYGKKIQSGNEVGAQSGAASGILK